MPWYQKHKDQQIPLHVSKQVLPVLKYGTVFHHNFPSLYHLTLVYFGQQKTCGRQGIKHKSLPTSSAPITRNAIKQYFLKEIVTKGRQIPREWYQTASHASLPYWGLLLLFGFAKHSAFWLRSSKAILHFPCFSTTDLQGTICTHEDKPTLHILLGQDQGTNHLSGFLFSYENWIKWAKKISLVSVSFRKPQDPGTFLK